MGDLAGYDARWARMAAAGGHPHGEADAVRRWSPRTVLDIGCGTGRVAIELARHGLVVVGVDADDDLLALARLKAPELTWVHADATELHLGRRFDVVVLAGNVPNFCEPARRPGLAATAARHVAADGVVLAGFVLEPGDGLGLDDWDAWCAGEGLALAERWATWDGDTYAGGDYAVSVHRPAQP